jgi:hypothetical protein
MRLLLEIIMYIPRLLIGGLFLFLPGYVIATLIFYVLTPELLGSFNFNNLSLNFIYKLSAFEKLAFGGIAITVMFFVHEKTKWGEITNKILPFDRFNYYD